MDPIHLFEALPTVLQGVIKLYLPSRSYEAYKWCHGELQYPDPFQTKRGVRWLPMGRLLSYLEIFLVDDSELLVTYILDRFPRKASQNELSELAAEAGHLEVVQHLKTTDPLTSLFKALQAGHLKIIQHLLPEYLSEKRNFGYDPHYYLFESVGKGGHLPIIKYLIEALPSGAIDSTFQQAAQYGHLGVVEYLFNSPKVHIANAFEKAASGGRLSIIKFFETLGWCLPREGLRGAAAGGHLGLVQHFISRGASNLDEAFQRAILYGRLKVFNYFVSFGVPFPSESLKLAGGSGCFEIVKHLIAHGVEGINEALEAAAKVDHLEMAQYLVSQGATKISGLFQKSFGRRRYKVLKYLRSL